MTTVHRTDVSGVPVFYGEASGPLTAALLFRVGQADEQLTGRGLTHLVEHLALAPLTRTHRECNGTVGMTVTTFDVAGRPDEVRDFLNAVTRSLAALPFDRLATEVRVLRTEDQRRAGALTAFAYGLRFGPAGYGTVDSPELGLAAATPERTDEWRRRWFTRGNAALCLSGPPPHGLDLSALPAGPRMPPQRFAPLAHRYPAWCPAADGFVAVSMFGARSTALWAATAVLQDRLYERLRTGEGRSYEISVGYDRLTHEDAGILVLTDALPGEADQVRDGIAVELSRLARDGATAEEVAEIRRRSERSREEEGYAAFLAYRHAIDTIVAGAVEPIERVTAELAALRGPEVGAALREALDTALWLVPRDVGVSDRRVHAISGWSETQVAGSSFRRARGVHADLAGDVLHVGAGGVTIVDDQQRLLTVERDGCRAVQAFDDGARMLWGADGIRLFVHPLMWADGADAVAAVDAVLDPGLVVAAGEPSGYEHPAEDAGSAANGPAGLLRRLRRR